MGLRHPAQTVFPPGPRAGGRLHRAQRTPGPGTADPVVRDRTAGDIDGLGLSLDRVRNRLERGNVEVELDQACGRGDFTPLGRLTLTKALDPERASDVSFDPVANTAPGLRLHPQWLADLRTRAYRRSRTGRDAD
jgi:hypothetical protein